MYCTYLSSDPFLHLLHLCFHLLLQLPEVVGMGLFLPLERLLKPLILKLRLSDVTDHVQDDLLKAREKRWKTFTVERLVQLTDLLLTGNEERNLLI